MYQGRYIYKAWRFVTIFIKPIRIQPQATAMLNAECKDSFEKKLV